MDVVGALEYDPELHGPQRHRTFLSASVVFKEVGHGVVGGGRWVKAWGGPGADRAQALRLAAWGGCACCAMTGSEQAKQG